MKTDIEIAQSCDLKPIYEIAQRAGIPADCVEPYGKYKAKILPLLACRDGNLPAAASDPTACHSERSEESISNAAGKLILVTAINPTPAGEGKTTTTIGLADALCRLGKKAMVALREPSLGPVFGIKGGAAGGGLAQVVPMEEINLHFTGDFHAIGAANNLLAAMLDNHIQQGNALNIDPRRICWKRCVDMNDRQLRHIVCGLGGKTNGVPREDGFDITVASEVMAILCLADGLADLKARLGRIIVGYTYAGAPVTADDLHAAGAMAALLKDALKPNLVQTLEGTPALIHGGPFANIAHGCNSVAATKLALSLADYTVTEAGFGADLGAEKFLDIKCRMAGLRPDAVVIVATVRALKYNGGVPKTALAEENTEALARGLPNLLRHVENITTVFGLPCVVAINRFPTDTEAELTLIEQRCRALGVNVALSEVHAKGSVGGEALAAEVLRLCDNAQQFVPACHSERSEESSLASAASDPACRDGNLPSADFRFAYDLDLPIREKIKAIAKRIYRAKHVVFQPAAEKQLAELEQLGFGGLPVCMAKTQYSFTDDASILGAPEGFNITVRQLKLCAGAGFVVALTGDIMTMPGLPKSPAAERIDVDESGRITGLF